MDNKIRQHKLKKLANNLLITVVAILLALVVCGIILAIMGFDVLSAYTSLLGGAFGSKAAFGETLNKAIPIILTAIGYATARKSGIINLGAEGQLYIGGLVSAIIGTNFSFLPKPLHISLALIGGMIGGALWGVIVAWLKISFGAHELITTIMLNNVAIQIISFFVTGPMRDLNAPGNFPQSRMTHKSAELPRIWAGTRLHAGLFIAIAMLIVFYILMNHTTKGYELRVTGMNRTAASYAGMNTSRIVIQAMLLAGAFAGLGGAVEILGIQHRLIENFSLRFGFDGISVALIGNSSAPGIAVSGLFLASLNSGANRMEMISNVPNGIVSTLQGLIILFIASKRIFQIRTSFRGNRFIKNINRQNKEGQTV